MKVHELRDALWRFAPEDEVVLEHGKLGIVPVGVVTRHGSQAIIREEHRLCPARLGRSARCELREGHKGAHQIDNGMLLWPNPDDPSPQGFFTPEETP